MTTPSVLQGSLQDFGLVEILQVVELGGMTGAIQISKDDGTEAIIYCNEGKVANCSEFDPLALTLGDVLQQLNMATYKQIEYAFTQQLSDVVGKRIGERLIAMRVIDEAQLREALRTKALWTIRELAMWPSGSYKFIASPDIQKLLPYGDVPLNIEVMRTAMEIVRYSDEWEKLKQFLPQGMSTSLLLANEIPQPMSFHRNTIYLFMQINAYKRVRRIASAMHQPELEMARELAQLVQQHLVVPVFEPLYKGRGRRMPLSEPAEKLRMENFQLLDLISRMELEWDKKHTPVEQLPTLVRFVNWTMDALLDAYRINRTELDPNMLGMLLDNEDLMHVGTYEFQVDHNTIDVEDFTILCSSILNDSLHSASDFYDEASSILQRMLRTIFSTINARVASPRERLENQEVWEAMFEQFALIRTSGV